MTWQPACKATHRRRRVADYHRPAPRDDDAHVSPPFRVSVFFFNVLTPLRAVRPASTPRGSTS